MITTLRSLAVVGALVALTGAAERSVAITVETCSGFGGTVAFGNCYKVDTTSRTWTAAEAAAQSLDPSFHLVSFHSSAEEAFVLGLVTPGEWWIGLSDSASEGAFVWSDGSTLDFSNWSPGEPNNSGDEDYVVINTGSQKWNDLGGGEQRPAVFSAPVPEPGIAGMVGLGLAVMGLRSLGQARGASGRGRRT